MIIFEILFKGPFLLKTPTLLVMQSLNEKGSAKLSYAKSIFDGCKSQLEMKFKRLQALDTILDASVSRASTGLVVANEDVKRDDASESGEIVAELAEMASNKCHHEEEVIEKIQNGIWTFQKNEIQGLANPIKKFSRYQFR
jgi:hypothetical protein